MQIYYNIINVILKQALRGDRINQILPHYITKEKSSNIGPNGEFATNEDIRAHSVTIKKMLIGIGVPHLILLRIFSCWRKYKAQIIFLYKKC